MYEFSDARIKTFFRYICIVSAKHLRHQKQFQETKHLEISDLSQKIRELELKNYRLRRELFQVSKKFSNLHDQDQKADILSMIRVPHPLPESPLQKKVKNIISERHDRLTDERKKELDDKISLKLAPDLSSFRNQIAVLQTRYNMLAKNEKYKKRDLDKIQHLILKNQQILSSVEQARHL